VTARLYVDTNLYLSALVLTNNSMEVRTRVFSRSNLDSLLAEWPAAITCSRAGVLDADRFLGVYMKNRALFRPFLRSRRVDQWRCYAQSADWTHFELTELLDNRALIEKAVKLFKQYRRASIEAPICALLPDVNWTKQREKRIGTVLSEVIVSHPDTDHVAGLADLVAYAGAPVKKVRIEAKILPTRSVPASEVPRLDGDNATDREALIRVRREMLDKVGWYSSEELASAAESTTSNPSQFAADQRATGSIFGVRFGKEWRYPKFQFDSERHTLPEMKPVLQALSPDEQGWDRLQWFLEPHEKLRGRVPLDVWRRDRKKVIEAANTERWDGRD
jgi:hypothetical protein